MLSNFREPLLRHTSRVAPICLSTPRQTLGSRERAQRPAPESLDRDFPAERLSACWESSECCDDCWNLIHVEPSTVAGIVTAPRYQHRFARKAI